MVHPPGDPRTQPSAGETAGDHYPPEDGEVIFKKYSPIGELQGVANAVREVLSKSFCPDGLVAETARTG